MAIEWALNKLRVSTGPIIVHEHDVELAWDEFFARTVSLVYVDNAVALLLTNYPESLLVAIYWLTQAELEEILLSIAEVDSGGWDLVISLTLRIYRNTSDSEAAQKVAKFDPKVAFGEPLIKFLLLLRAPLWATARESFIPFFWTFGIL